MATTVTINSITSGTSPYNVWVCDTCFGTCQYIDTFTTLPYSFTLPSVYETYPTYVVKIIDANNCTFCETLSVSDKLFQDGLIFEFQDGEEYKFQ
jgi:hypothetical protein